MRTILTGLFVLVAASILTAADTATPRGDALLKDYLQNQTAALSTHSAALYPDLPAWQAARPELERQVREMLGLDPWPEKTPLHATITGGVDCDGFTVENLHFQSQPGLYVTANLYRPKNLSGKAPAVLYLCGHGLEKDKATGVSYGNKTHYQHHGAWFAKHGYVCLILDTLQLGEIEGHHRITFDEAKWWSVSRGYTPTGVEAWNAVRAIDYLLTRPEVDPERLGVTGRSGGGGSSWWITAIDQRIKTAVPVAGITDLHNHILDHTIDGHCDCMFMLNTYQWDYWQVAALAAPRPVLLANTDKDNIFPLDGVVRLHSEVRHLYHLLGVPRHWGLNITEGPHKDTQELQLHAFVWMERFLKNSEAPIESLAMPRIPREQLRVFQHLPTDQRNTTVEESFVPAAPAPTLPETPAQWASQRDAWLNALRTICFRAWPAKAPDSAPELVSTRTLEGIQLTHYSLQSQPGVSLDLYLLHSPTLKEPELITLNVLDQKGWKDFAAMALTGDPLPPSARADLASQSAMLLARPWVMAYLAPRGIGPTSWSHGLKKDTQSERRLIMLGQTTDSMRVWDVRRTVQSVRSIARYKTTPLWLQAEGAMAGVTLYASLFEPDITRLDLWQLPHSHTTGPTFLNVLRVLDLPAAVALAAERSRVRIYDADATAWTYPSKVAAQLGWPTDRIDIRTPPPAP